MRCHFRSHPYLTLLCGTLIFHASLFIFLQSLGYQANQSTDGSQYRAISDNLLAGRGFSVRTIAPYMPDTIRTPIYPIFLAVVKRVTGSYDTSLRITMILGSFIPLAGMALSRLLSPSWKLAWIAGIALALEPHLINYSFIFGSEGVFLPLAAGAIVTGSTLIKRPTVWLAVGTGTLFGIAVLARPIIQFIPILLVVPAWIEWRRMTTRVWRRFALFLGLMFATYILVVSPWIIRNYMTFGVFDFANIGWFNMYTRVAASAEAMSRGVPYDQVRIEYLQHLYEKGYVAKSPVDEWDVHGYEFKDIFKKETFLVWGRYPKEVVLVHFSAFSTVVTNDKTMQFLHDVGLISFPYPSFAPLYKFAHDGFFATFTAIWQIRSWPLAFSMVARLFWALAFFLSLLCPILLWKKDRSAAIIAGALTLFELYIVAFSLNAAAQADSRYRTQFVFAEFPLMIIALSVLFGRNRVKDRQTLRCPVCGFASETRKAGKRKGFDLFVCGACDAWIVHPMPMSEELKAFYSHRYFFGGQNNGGYVDYDADKQATSGSFERFLDLIKHARGGESGALLDIGAATGIFLDLARHHGWDVRGQELSEAAAEIARDKGINVIARPVCELPFSLASFDAVSMLDVIEHLPEPRDFLHDVAGLLKIGGTLLINTPDSGSVYARIMGLRWHAITPPEHVVLFRLKTLRMLLDSAGFDVEWSGRVKKSFRLSYILYTMAHWMQRPFLLRLGSAVARTLLDRLNIPLDLRDNIVIIARKRPDSI